MNKELEHSFVEKLEKHQNIIHKVCRLYTNNYDAHNDLFQEITIQLWKAYPKFRVLGLTQLLHYTGNLNEKYKLRSLTAFSLKLKQKTMMTLKNNS